MKLSFLGAAKQVTGSMYLLTLDSGYKILVDCGMDYEVKKNPVAQANLFPFEPIDIDLVLLTHAHIDHSGNLPALVNHGFKGHILCTPATAELTTYLLYDSANIQLNDYRRSLGRAKKTRRDGVPKPLFTEKNVKQTVEQFYTVPLQKPFVVNPQLQITFIEAGHLLGAAGIEVAVEEKGKLYKIGFSGDLGRSNSKLVQNGEIFNDVDYLVTESTYGGRKHVSVNSAEDELMPFIQKTCIEFRGRLVIPAFSVGRTQAIVFTINQLKKKGLIPAWLKVFVDSPLAIKSTPVYERHAYLLNEEAQDFMQHHGSLFHFDGIEYLEGMDEHDELMNYFDPCIIISAAGMVEGGRIQEQPVLATVLRAGLAMHQGFLNYFNHADNAYVSAYRKHTVDNEFEIVVEYLASPTIQGRTLILIDPMLATGRSMFLTYKALLTKGKPERVFVVSLIGSEQGIAYIQQHMPQAHIFIGTVDPALDAHSYIVPGLGDAGDLSFGEKA